MSYHRQAGPRRAPLLALVAAVVVVLLAGIGFLVFRRGDAATEFADAPAAAPVPAAPRATGALRVERVADPARSLVKDAAGRLLASFTDGAHTVRLTGPTRTFSDPAFTSATVTTDAWIRLAPRAWHAGAERESWFRPWLDRVLASKAPDVLAVALQYVKGAPRRTDTKGVRYAGDASFGPVSASDPDGRAENSDFKEYLGISWKFPDAGLREPNRSRYGDVDCSGYLRLVYGYRMGYPLRGTSTPGAGLPRRAFAISKFGPGVEVVKNRGVPARDYDHLQPGDLVFFNSDPVAGTFRTDHSGIFLGVDDSGHYRFISSRTKADGPTFGDLGGAALLDGTGHWAERFRNARRL